MLHRVVLITGMSGAGKTVALKAMEDIGFEAIDNLPLYIIPLLTSSPESLMRPLAIGIDIRSRDFDANHFTAKTLPLIKQKNPNAQMLFLECDNEVLLHRFTETRRKHPISSERPIMDSIRTERAVMNILKEQADLVLDTSDYSLNELRVWIKENFSGDKKENFFVKINSFSYKKGLPRDSDLIFDVRFLKNPHYVQELKDLNGKDAKIAKYIKSDPAFPPIYDKLHDLILELLPKYLEEGKTYLTISIGCTGGKHRSVFVAETLRDDLKKKGYNVSLNHRDIS
jgi:RNase adapter protein RapZ